MADKKKAAPAADPQANPEDAPAMNLMAQYIGDLSFENPNAPKSIIPNPAAPSINVSINTQVKKQEDEVYAVELMLNAKAERDGEMLFNAELVYGGLFRIKNVPENQMPPLLMIECPRLLFPFARQVLANVTQQGGFPPIMMEPVDFATIYRQNLAAMAKQTEAASGKKPN